MSLFEITVCGSASTHLNSQPEQICNVSPPLAQHCQEHYDKTSHVYCHGRSSQPGKAGVAGRHNPGMTRRPVDEIAVIDPWS